MSMTPRLAWLVVLWALVPAATAQPVNVPIPAIQGSGAQSPLAGQRVTTQGVVTQRTSNGFFLQDAAGDGDPATSDGIFVFTSSAPAVEIGQWLQLDGTVTEFDVSLGTANPAAEARPLTELTDIANVVELGSGTVAPTPVTLPVPQADGLERFEGMLVTLSGPGGAPLTVQQNFFQGRFGLLTVAADGRRETPTNRHRPGSPEALALADLNARSTLLLDDASSLQNPVPTPYLEADGRARAGDTVAPLTGTIDFGLATASSAGIVAYRLQPTVAPVVAAANPRPATPPEVGGNLRLAAFNVLNYFTTFRDGSTADGQTGQACTQGGSTPSTSLCRGANDAAEFARQRAKIIAALAAIDADVVGLVEIQNNGSVATQDLADGLNAVLGAGHYAVVPDPATGVGDDAIKVAMLYRPARLARVGPSLSDPLPVYSRVPVAQVFEAPNGERVSVIVNHFKSKGCGDATGADLDQGDGQGCYNALRLQQAQALLAFAGSVQAQAGRGELLVTGDLNAYGREDPIEAFTAAGYTDELARFADLAYSFVFDGASGRLDHALTSPALSARVSGAATWAINADEASLRDYNQEFKAPRSCSGRPCPPDPYAPDVYRSSDHDPVLVGVDLYKTIAGTAARERLVGTPGDDILIGDLGADRLEGGAGADLFAYRSLREAGDVVLDFVPGEDRIDLRALFAGSGYAGDDALADGWVRLQRRLAGSALLVDLDGPAGPAAARALLTLRAIEPIQIDGTRDLLVR